MWRTIHLTESPDILLVHENRDFLNILLANTDRGIVAANAYAIRKIFGGYAENLIILNFTGSTT